MLKASEDPAAPKDTVSLYQVVEWVPGSGWRLTAPFDTVPELEEFRNKLENSQPVSIDTDIVNAFNAHISDGAGPVNTGSPDGTGTYAADVPKGMYIAIVSSGEKGTIYNPIVVSVDFSSNGTVPADTSAIPVSDSSQYNGVTAVAKKSSLTLEKAARDGKSNDGNFSETIAVGDTLTFTVATQIPPFVTYNSPSFVITDELSGGLTYQGDAAVLSLEDAIYRAETVGNGYRVTFDPAYLKKIAAKTDVEIRYTAKVTNNAVSSVNHDVNTVTLDYASNPNTDAASKLKDRTNHYTFDIDAALLGESTYEATEIVKVGIDAAGNEITRSSLMNGGSVGALQGAKFDLYAADEEYNRLGGAIRIGLESGPDGRIKITGLDAGKYVLTETRPPAGYIKWDEDVRIWIDAHINQNVKYTEDGCEIITDELEYYTVTVNGDQTANYTIRNSSDPAATSVGRGDTVVGIDGDKGKIKNTQGAELPSTGGPGTTLFYLAGLIMTLLAGAGIVLKRRRREAA